jgi:hypothetical protein
VPAKKAREDALQICRSLMQRSIQVGLISRRWISARERLPVSRLEE